MSFAVVNLGCRVNRAESDAITQKMLLKDTLAPLESANKIIVNTCTVTGVAEKKTRKTIRHILNINKDASVIVTGCAAQIDPEFYKNLSNRIEVVPKFEILNKCKTTFKTKQEISNKVGTSRVNVKIQDGCDNACTFCIVHVARGKSISYDPKEIIDKCKELDEAGVKEVVLTGINLGSYSKPNLPSLLYQLLDNTKNCRYRISSIEPPEVTSELIECIKNSNSRICKHLHLPLQSGSNDVLKAMDRHYSCEEFLGLVNAIYNEMPNFSLTTDCIVGFPGESEEDFSQTVEICKKAHFSKIHVFPYSKRKNTPATLMPNQIEQNIKKQRAKALLDLSSSLRKQEFLKRVGTSEQVVIENDNKGTTESYFTLKSKDFVNPGQIMNVELSEALFFG